MSRKLVVNIEIVYETKEEITDEQMVQTARWMSRSINERGVFAKPFDGARMSEVEVKPSRQ